MNYTQEAKPVSPLEQVADNWWRAKERAEMAHAALARAQEQLAAAQQEEQQAWEQIQAASGRGINAAGNLGGVRLSDMMARAQAQQLRGEFIGGVKGI